jgi:putative transcription factor
MQCDLCGKDSQLFVARIEGTELQVCKDCSAYGQVLRRAMPTIVREKKPSIIKPFLPQNEIVLVIVPDYGDIIRKTRESLNLRQEDLAKKLAEKESLIQKIESSHLEPSIELARKLEKHLNIKLIEKHEEKKQVMKGTGGDKFTIGDIINIKRKD